MNFRKLFKESKGKISHVIEREVNRSYVDKLPPELLKGKNVKWNENQFSFSTFSNEKKREFFNFRQKQIKLKDFATDEMLCSWFWSHPKIIFFKLSVAENSRWKMSINRIMVLNFGLFQFCDFSAVVQRSFLPMKFYQTLEKQKKSKVKNVSVF